MDATKNRHLLALAIAYLIVCLATPYPVFTQSEMNQPEGTSPTAAPEAPLQAEPAEAVSTGAADESGSGTPEGKGMETTGENTAPANATDVPANEQTSEQPVAPVAAPQAPKKNAARNKNKEQVAEHFFRAPEDPSFLYETRFIPGHRKTEEFLSKELEKEVIVERIQEEQDFRKSLNKIKINMPDYRQVAVVAIVIGLFILYRFRVKGMRRRTRYR